MKLRVGVIGVGSIGFNHARVLAELGNVELVAVVDVDARAVQAVAHRYRLNGYTDYLRMLDIEHLDAVTVAVPTNHHLAVAMEVIQRGIPVLIEKPIASTVAEGRQLVAAAAARCVLLMVGHIERFNPSVSALKAHLAEGELGRVFQISAQRQGPFPDRVRDVGVVIDLAVHDLDVMRHISGAEITRVYAETEQHIHSAREDLLSGVTRMSDGTIGTLNINWLTPTKIRELTVTGERGMFRLDYLTQDLYFFENALATGPKWETMRVLRGVGEGRMIRYVIAKKEPLRAELEAFCAAVQGNLPPPVSGADGLKALELAQALVASGRSHQAIEL